MWKTSKPQRGSHGLSLQQCPLQTFCNSAAELQFLTWFRRMAGKAAARARLRIQEPVQALPFCPAAPPSSAKINWFIFTCKSVLPVCTYMHHVYTWHTQRPTTVTGVCWVSLWMLELNPGILEVFLTADNALSSTLFAETESHSVVHNEFQRQRNGSLS